MEKKRNQWWERCPNYRCSQNCWSRVLGQNYDHGVQRAIQLYMAFIFLLCDWYDQKLELLLQVILTSLKIKFEHTQLSVCKIDTTMSKTASINPLLLVDSSNRTVKWSHTMIFSCFFWRIRSLIFSLIDKQCLIYFIKVCRKLNGRRKLRFKTQWKIHFLPLLYG